MASVREGAKTGGEPRRAASLEALAGDPAALAERYRADIAGGGSSVRESAVKFERTSLLPEAQGGARLTGEARAYHGETEHIQDCPRAVYFEFMPGVAGLPKEWREWDRLELETLNDGPVPLGVELTVFGARSRLLSRREFSPGEGGVVSVELRDLALTSGILPPYEPQCVRVALFVPEGGPPARCLLRGLELAGRRAPGPVLDRWGQRLYADWPGKVQSDADLFAAREAETRELAAMQPVPRRGRFGGWTDGPRFAATGFFRLERDGGGHWWYADPEGLPFWSTGPTGIDLGDATDVAGREEVFAELPKDAPDWVYDEQRRPRFFGLNLFRKYGAVETWAERVRERLSRWGCNTVANWSDLRVPGGRVAYVKPLSSRFAVPTRFGRLPDVFDPEWARALRARFLAEARPLSGDPWLIGYFVDNELPWRNLDRALMEEFAERYFSTIRDALKEADPNHLYLGCRFVREMPDPVIPRAAGKYVDVLSVNAYSVVPRRVEFDAWHGAAGKPIQIGEHQFALRDPRGLRTPWMSLTADERRRAIPAYSRAAAELPYCLGAHWFQYMDQPNTGRPSNGENMLIGLVDITDRPYPHMAAAFREIAEQCYAWHLGRDGAPVRSRNKKCAAKGTEAAQQ